MNYWMMFHIILLIGAIQGIILGVVLWRPQNHRTLANRLLAAILFFFAYRLLTEVLRSMGYIHINSWTYHVFLEYNWIYGSLIYLYIRSFLDPNARFNRKYLIHFTPVLIEFVLSNYVKAQNFYWDGSRESLSWLGCQIYILWMHTPFPLIVFAGLILWYVFRAKKHILKYTEEGLKPVQKEDVRWSKLILTWFQIFAAVVIIGSLVDYVFLDFAFNPNYKLPVYGGMAILTYWLALQGYTRRNMPYLEPKSKDVIPLVNHQPILEKLQEAMEKQCLYKDQTLSLAQLAVAIDIKPYQLTQVLNRSLQKNFSDFVNEYRVKEVQRLINSPAHRHLTLLALAFESGFNSKASFNRVIKRLTGKSPKELRR